MTVLGFTGAGVPIDEFCMGLSVELEHSHDPETDVTEDDLAVTGKIALAHLKEFPPTTIRAWQRWKRRRRVLVQPQVKPAA